MKKFKLLAVIILSLTFVMAFSSLALADVHVGNVMVEDSNAADIFGDGTASYDMASATLTLNNANINTSYAYAYGIEAAIYSTESITINLIGQNKIGGMTMGTEITSLETIIANEDITFTGSGSLDIAMPTAYSYVAIKSVQGGLTFKDGATVNISGGIDGYYIGINTVKDINILNNAKLDLKLGRSDEGNVYGLWATQGELNMADSALLTMSGGYANNNFRNIDAQAFSLSGNAIAIIDPSETCPAHIDGMRIAGDLTIADNAALRVKTGNADDENNIGIDLDGDGADLIMTGGKLNVQTGGGATTDGLYSEGVVNISGGHALIIASDATNDSTGLRTDGFTMTGGSLIARASNSVNTPEDGRGLVLIGTNTLNISGGAAAFSAPLPGRAMNEDLAVAPSSTGVTGNYQSSEIKFNGGGSFGDTTITATATAPTPAPTPAPTDGVNAIASTNVAINYNGSPVSVLAYNIGGNNFFKLRDFATMVNGSDKQFEVTWDADAKAIDLIAGSAYTAVGGEMDMTVAAATTTASKSADKVYMAGEMLTLEAYKIGGQNYFKLRDLAKAMDIGVEWVAATSTINLDSGLSYTE